MKPSDYWLASFEEELAAKGLTVTGRKQGAPKMQNFAPQAPLPPPSWMAVAPPPGPVTYRTALANIMGSNDATVAQVTLELYDPKEGVPKVFRGSGASKRDREDSHDVMTGEVLAAARAYQELSARLFREARKRVRKQEAERRAKAYRRLAAMPPWPHEVDASPESRENPHGEFVQPSAKPPEYYVAYSMKKGFLPPPGA